MYGSYAHIGTLDYHILSYGYFMKRKRTNSFHLLAKPTGAACNLDCGYCFFLSKEMLYPGSRFRMADELLEEYIRQLLEAHNVSVVTIAWQGGEPMLMGLPFFQRSIEYVEKHRKRRVSIEYTIQTNATLIDDEWAAFFKKHDFLVGVSVDGCLLYTSSWVFGAEFDHRGQRIATYSGDGSSRIWDAHSRKLLFELQGHTKWLNKMCIRDSLGGVPGSYGFDVVARVSMRDGQPDRRFLMQRLRRYDPKQLSDSLAELGWKTIERIDYGTGGKKTMALILLQKQ